MNESVYFVAAEGCLRCGACSSLAPLTFAMGEAAAVVVRQPETTEEIAAAEAALFNCPVLAIRKRSTRA
jgi:ferredoxin